MPTISRDGVELGYHEAGSGSSALLIPGWCCSSWFMHKQAEHLAKSHRVVSVDLRGHGESAAPEGEYTIESLADDIAWMARELEIERAAIIGFSMGAHVALQLAIENADLASSLVLIDASPFGTPAEKHQIFDEALPNFLQDMRTTRAALWSTFFDFPNASEDLHTETLRRAAETSDRVAYNMFANFVDWDGRSAAQRWTRPVLMLMSDFKINDPEQMAALFVRGVLGKTVGAGHMHLLEIADQVNAMIDAYHRTYATA